MEDEEKDDIKTSPVIIEQKTEEQVQEKQSEAKKLEILPDT